MRNRNTIIGWLLVCLAAACVSVAAFFRWFEGGRIMYFWDAYVPVDFSTNWWRMSYSWLAGSFPGYSSTGWLWLPYVGILGLLSAVTRSFSLSQYTLYVLLSTISVMSFFMLARHLLAVVGADTNSRISRIVTLLVSVSYAFNIYTYFYAYEMFNPAAYLIAFMPLSLLSLFRLFPLERDGIRSGRRWTAVYIAAQILMVPGFASYVFLAQYFVIVGAYLVLYWILRVRRIASWDTAAVVVHMLLTVALQWWWFYPTLLNFRAQFESQSTVGTMVYLSSDPLQFILLNTLRMTGSAAQKNGPFIWARVLEEHNALTFISFAFPMFISYAAARLGDLRRKRLLAFLVLLLFVGVFIVKFVSPPYSGFMKLIFSHVPFFSAFRDAYQKAGLYAYLWYFVIAAAGTGLFLKRIRWLPVRLALLAAVTASAAVATSPFFLFGNANIRQLPYTYRGKVQYLSDRTVIPAEYYELKRLLEPSCKGTYVMEIPRPGLLSSAQWGKQSSYLGQDMLVHLIDCTFLGIRTIQNDADAYSMAPYYYMSQRNMAAFAGYLRRNDIGYVLLRRDYLPNSYYTNWGYYDDPDIVAALLTESGHFSVETSTKYYTLYKLDGVSRNNGVTLSDESIYTNADLHSTKGYTDILSEDNATSSAVYVTSYADPVTSDSVRRSIITSNCIGCVIVNPDETQVVPKQEDPLVSLKQSVKKLLGRSTEDRYVPSSDIGVTVSLANRQFLTITDRLEHGVPQTGEQLEIYGKYLDDILRLMTIRGDDYFNWNNQLAMIRAFLVGQQHHITALGAKHTVFDPYSARLAKAVEYVNETIWESSAGAQLLALRLDIPRDGTYTCRTRTMKGFSARRVTMLGDQPISGVDGDLGAVPLKQGSYRVELAYDADPGTSLIAAKDGVTLVCTEGMVAASGPADDFSVTRIDPTKYKVRFADTVHKRFLLFNQTYHDDWQAYTTVNGKHIRLRHFRNGYANAWRLDPGIREVTIEFTRQGAITRNALATCVLVVGMTGLYLYIQGRMVKRT